MLLEFIAVTNENLKFNDLKRIAILKSEHWHYPVDSQIKWIFEHYKKSDIHIQAVKDGKLIAYAGLVSGKCNIDGIQRQFCGLGNVCVSIVERGTGVGKQLVEAANSIIDSRNMMGLLLCHQELIPFYQKCGWITVITDNIFVEGNSYSDYLMSKNVILKNRSYIDIEHIF